VDYDRLYYAVSMAESGNCASAQHKKNNNCVSIMTWTGGKRHLQKFESIEANKAAFTKLWSEHYKAFPTMALAKKYTGGDSAGTWLNAVKTYY